MSAAPSACLFGKRLPPPEARCNPRTQETQMPSAKSLIGLIMVQVLPVIPPEGKFLESSLELSPPRRPTLPRTECVFWGVGGVWAAVCWISSPLTPLLVSWSEVDRIGLS